LNIFGTNVTERLCNQKLVYFPTLTKQQRKQMSGVLNKAGVKRELSDTVKARKLAYYGHTMRN